MFKNIKYFLATSLLIAELGFNPQLIRAAATPIPAKGSVLTDSVEVSGKILDMNGNPVPEVSIAIEGITKVPCITGKDGKYTLKTLSTDVWVNVTPLSSFHSKRIQLNNRTNLDIYLAPSDNPTIYDEVSNGFENVPLKNTLGAVENFNTGGKTTLPYETLDQFFQGKLSGMMVSNHSGMPGEGAYAFLRGVRSISAQNQPLYIVDGVPYEYGGIFESIIDGHNYNPLSNIEPQDITNVTVLKDASLGALYGSKASNGVVIIETLRPNELATKIDLNVRNGFSFVPKNIPVLNSNQFRTYAQQVLLTRGTKEEQFIDIYPGLYDDPYSEDYYKYSNETNWQNEVFRNTLSQDVHLSVKGGDEIARYGISVGYLNHKGIIKNTDYNRYNIRFVGDFNIFPWMRMNLSACLNYNFSNLMNTGLNFETSPIYSSLFKTPLMTTFEVDETGQPLKGYQDPVAFGVSNPSAVINKFRGLNNNYRLTSSARFYIDLNNNLKWNSIIGVNLNRMRESVYMPNAGLIEYFDGEAINVAKHQTNTYLGFYGESKLAYKKSFEKKHNLNASAGLRVFSNQAQYDYGIAENLPENDQYTSLSNGQDILARIGGDYGEWNWLSIYGMASYDFKEKYILRFAMSTDASSRSGINAPVAYRIGNAPFGVFPSVTAAWRMSSESLLKNINWLEDLKVNASYGLVGNDDIGNYNSYAFYTPILYRSTTGLILGTQPNTYLKYEESKQLNIGLDMSLIGERINVSFDYYDIQTDDMFIYEKRDAYLGYDTRPTNGGSMNNKGWEFNIDTRIINNTNFKWDVGLNIAHFENKVTSITGDALIRKFEGGEIISAPGHEVNSFYGYVAEGVYATSEDALAANLRNEKLIAYRAGDVKYKDFSGPDGKPDGVINQFDKTYIGSANPDYFGGITSVMKYKNWELDMLFQYVYGNDIYNFTRYQIEKTSDLSNQSTAVLNRWMYEGQQTEIPKVQWDDPIGNSSFSTRFIEDGSYLRLKHLTLKYTIPDKISLFKKELFRYAQFYITGTNLYTFTRYLGYDPEFSYSVDPLMQGIDYGQMPSTRSVMLGIKFGL